MWLVLIVVHAASGLAAFAFAWVAVDPAKASARPGLLYGLVASLGAMVVFVLGAMAAHWGALPGASKAVFIGLVALAGFMVYRAERARRRLPRVPDDRAAATAHVDDIGFDLVALFNGFAIVTAIDLGAPPWLVAALAVLATAAGHALIRQEKAAVRSEPAP